jgi:hypothetical protein
MVGQPKTELTFPDGQGSKLDWDFLREPRIKRLLSKIVGSTQLPNDAHRVGYTLREWLTIPRWTLLIEGLSLLCPKVGNLASHQLSKRMRRADDESE